MVRFKTYKAILHWRGLWGYPMQVAEKNGTVTASFVAIRFAVFGVEILSLTKEDIISIENVNTYTLAGMKIIHRKKRSPIFVYSRKKNQRDLQDLKGRMQAIDFSVDYNPRFNAAPR